MARRPCLDCGTPTTRKTSRCDRCEREHQAHRNRRRVHYQGGYRARREALRLAAPDGPCWICGERIPRAEWTADHVIASDPSSPLRPAHRRCNSARGAGGG